MKILKIVLLLIGGTIITILFTPLFSISGLELTDISCRANGFPFAFSSMGSKCSSDLHCPLVACTLDFNILAFILDILFWFLILLFIAKLIIKLKRRKKHGTTS